MPQSAHLSPAPEAWTPQTVLCKVHAVRRMTPKSVQVTFDPGAALARFRHEPGQRITLCMALNGETCYRSYNLINEPGALPRVAVKQVSEGGGSQLINERLEPGDVVEVVPPVGGILNDRLDHTAHHFLLFAAGSGITPLFSLARHALVARPDHRVTLIYANSSARDIMMQEELEQLAGSPRLEVYHILGDGATGEDLSTGRLDHAKLHRLMEQFRRTDMPEQAFLSGPPGFMDMVKDIVAGLDRPLPITGYSFMDQPFVHPEDSRIGRRTSRVTVTLQGQTRTLEDVPRHQTLLEAADAAGMAMPANCRSGICHRCKARLISGYTTTIPGSHGTRTVEEGWVLCCRQRPASDDVEIEMR